MRKKLVKGNLEWVKPRDKHLNAVKFTEDSHGKITYTKAEYNWMERLLIRLRLMKDKRYNGKYIVGIDPFDK